jgi:hypothetical protein
MDKAPGPRIQRLMGKVQIASEILLGGAGFLLVSRYAPGLGSGVFQYLRFPGALSA